jgi:hypothetical protein
MAKGGKAMVLISDSQSFHQEMNIDDKLGEKIDIPTIIITNKVGGAITRYMAASELNKVTMSIKFVGIRETRKVNIKLFMRSDDLEALHFFKEFRQYYEELCML